MTDWTDWIGPMGIGVLAGSIGTGVAMLPVTRRTQPDDDRDFVLDLVRNGRREWAASFVEHGRLTQPPPEWMWQLEEWGGRIPPPPELDAEPEYDDYVDAEPPRHAIEAPGRHRAEVSS